jgi:hypothetical protein
MQKHNNREFGRAGLYGADILSVWMRPSAGGEVASPIQCVSHADRMRDTSDLHHNRGHRMQKAESVGSGARMSREPRRNNLGRGLFVTPLVASARRT